MPRSKVSQQAHRHFDTAKAVKRYHETLDFVNMPFAELYGLQYGQLQELMKSLKSITKLVGSKPTPNDDNTHADNTIILNLTQKLTAPAPVIEEPVIEEPVVEEPVIEEPVVEPEVVPVPIEEVVPVKKVVRRGAKYLARKKAEELRLASRTPEEIEADEATRRAKQERIQKEQKEQKELADERTRRERYPELYDDCRATRGHISSYHNPT